MESTKILAAIPILIILMSILSAQIDMQAQAEESDMPKTWIPEQEVVSYFDSNGVFTVAGNVKNQDSFAILPSISITVIDGENKITKTISHVPIPAMTDIPFKTKFPEVSSKNPKVLVPILMFKKIELEKSTIEVIYDKTLKKHDDGHVTGTIINNGEQTAYHPKVFAIANGYDGILDVVQNLEYIEKIEPGETREFSMYVDPSITDEVFYYSCFAVTESFVRPMYTERNGEKFYFRYDSGTWFTAPEFNDKGTKLSLRTQNSFPLPTYANFEFPSVSQDEKFNVYVNGEPKEIIQSVDERGNWHVAFTVEPRESGNVLITGFDEGYDPTGLILIPDWVRINASWWANDLAGEEVFIRGLEFMVKENTLRVSESQDKNMQTVPEWFKNTANWWADDKIDNRTFVYSLQNLIDREIIRV